VTAFGRHPVYYERSRSVVFFVSPCSFAERQIAASFRAKSRNFVVIKDAPDEDKIPRQAQCTVQVQSSRSSALEGLRQVLVRAFSPGRTHATNDAGRCTQNDDRGVRHDGMRVRAIQAHADGVEELEPFELVRAVSLAGVSLVL
jgi:hypothetical protein